MDYLKEVQEDILENIDDFKKKPEPQQQMPGQPTAPISRSFQRGEFSQVRRERAYR